MGGRVREAHDIQIVQIARFSCALLAQVRVLLAFAEHLDGLAPRRGERQGPAGRVDPVHEPVELKNPALGIEPVAHRGAGLEFRGSQIHGTRSRTERRDEVSLFALDVVLVIADRVLDPGAFAFELSERELRVAFLAFTLLEHGLEFEPEKRHGLPHERPAWAALCCPPV